MFEVENSEFGKFKRKSKPELIMAVGILGMLIQELSKAIIGEEHNVYDRIYKVELALHRIRIQFDNDLIHEIKINKLERLADHIW
jgi:hypothetical protein